MKLYTLITFCFILCATRVHASYRVYRLKLIHYDNKGKVDRIEYKETNLDPYQYENYHAGYGWMKVEMVATWYCPGDTSRRKYCKRPKVTERGLASLDHPKRVGLPYELQPIIPR